MKRKQSKQCMERQPWRATLFSVLGDTQHWGETPFKLLDCYVAFDISQSTCFVQLLKRKVSLKLLNSSDMNLLPSGLKVLTSWGLSAKG